MRGNPQRRRPAKTTKARTASDRHEQRDRQRFSAGLKALRDTFGTAGKVFGEAIAELRKRDSNWQFACGPIGNNFLFTIYNGRLGCHIDLETPRGRKEIRGVLGWVKAGESSLPEHVQVLRARHSINQLGREAVAEEARRRIAKGKLRGQVAMITKTFRMEPGRPPRFALIKAIGWAIGRAETAQRQF